MNVFLSVEEMYWWFYVSIFCFFGLIMLSLLSLLIKEVVILRRDSSSGRLYTEKNMNHLLLLFSIILLMDALFKIVHFEPELYRGGIETSFIIFLLFAGFPLLMLVLTFITTVLLKIFKFSRFNFHFERRVSNEERLGEKKHKLERNRKIFHILLIFLLFSVLVLFYRSLVGKNPSLSPEAFWGPLDGKVYAPEEILVNGFSLSQIIIIGTFYGTTCVTLTMEATRLSRFTYFPFIAHVEKTLRENELEAYGSHTHIAMGFLIASVFLSPIALFTTLVIFSIGDTMAAIIGTRYGFHRYSFIKKSYEGSLAGFLSTLFIAYLFTGIFWAFAAACIFLFPDLPTPKFIKISDNIFIPLLSVVVFHFLYYMGIPAEFVLLPWILPK